ncbi:L-tyrosine/L-tryptophan isonitrile synthase family protein [Jiella mangrovi]|uniref:L-tyrosine/L-tryptophan isonitrile synthase family protein n=1 Tax=Jiella mangrovi TaxID=2821407 RepID=A0ABS4BK95_9HYPH|nr:L-tyrosine/L-tryptophan isonitrile synthase family protein [Jiella mangrovi]MBP0616596.1 L-tyrosine/L-tryptophan isonitrile synthase family protein [Jiella mangrovi]
MTCLAPSYLDVGRNGEAISDARLSFAGAWPETDPRLQPQKTRLAGADDARMVAECVRIRRLDFDAFRQKVAGRPVHEQVFELINHRTIQFNSRSRFAECEIWKGRIRQACEKGEPVPILLPVFCVIRNPVKRLQLTVPTTAEEVSLRHMANIAALIREIYPAGAVFHLITDSTFYGLPFGVNAVEALRYVDLLGAMVDRIGCGDVIRLHDMAQILSGRFEDFQESYENWSARFHDDPCADGLSPQSYDVWLASMAASINTAKRRLDYDTLRAQFGGSGLGHTTDELYHRAKTGLAEYRALKAAAADLQWEEQFFPNAVRATIHTKGVPVLGLRLYPEYKLRANLLPYHGIGVLRFGPKYGLHYMTVEPEMFVCGREEFTRITDERGTTLHYLGEGGGVRRGTVAGGGGGSLAAGACQETKARRETG